MEINWDEIPCDLDWVAQDGDGYINAYSHEPVPHEKYPMWLRNKGEVCAIYGKHAHNRNWRQTKSQRPE
jgi:hypothetical protein